MNVGSLLLEQQRLLEMFAKESKLGNFRYFAMVQQRARMRNIRLRTKVILRGTIKKALGKLV